MMGSGESRFPVLFIKHEVVTVTVHLIYKCFVFCRAYYFSMYTVNLLVVVVVFSFFFFFCECMFDFSECS